MIIIRQKEYSVAETTAIGSAIGGLAGLGGSSLSTIGLKKRLKKENPELSDKELDSLTKKVASGRIAKATAGGMATGAALGFGYGKGKGSKFVEKVIKKRPAKTKVHTEGLNDSGVIKHKFKRSHQGETRSIGLWG